MNARIIFGTILIILGISALFEISIFRFIIPVFLIWLGWKVISGKKAGANVKENTTIEDDLNETLVFSGMKKTVDSDAFKGGKVVVILGSGELDLTNTQAKSDFRLELVAVLGEIKIRIPKNWKVSSGAVAILGAVNNNTRSSSGKKVTVTLDGAAVLGNIEILN